MNGQKYDISFNVSETNNIPLQLSEVPNLNLQVGETINIVDGTNNYNSLKNKPQINSVELQGNKTFDDLGMSALTNIDIFNILK